MPAGVAIRNAPRDHDANEGNVNSQLPVRDHVDVMLQREGLAQLCLWGADSFTTPKLWEIVGKLRFRSDVRKIERVEQRNARVRFDILTEAANATTVLETLNDFGSRKGWFIREHKARNGRPRARDEIVIPITITTNSSLRMASWNIFGAKTKLGELEYWVREEKLHVVALQETLRSAKRFRITLPGYRVFESAILWDRNAKQPGKRGLALMVSSALTCHSVGEPSAYCVFARVYGPMLAAPWVVGSVYIPNAGDGRKKAYKQIRKTISNLREKYGSNVRITMMGDWNAEAHVVEGLLLHHNIPDFKLSTFRGSNLTWERGNCRSAIDQIATSESGFSLLGHACVDRTQDSSDHWPVMISIKAHTDLHQVNDQAPAAQLRMKVRTLFDHRESIAHDNSWQPLVGLTDVNDLVDRFIANSHSLAKTHDIMATSEYKRKSWRLTHEAKKAIKYRRDCYKNWKNSVHCDGQDSDDLHNSYIAAKVESKKEVGAAIEKSWNGHVNEMAEAMHKGDSRKVWLMIKGMNKTSDSSSLSDQPLLVNDELVMDPGKIREIWADHYEKLSSIPEHFGYDLIPRDEDYWRSRDPDQLMHPNLRKINEQIKWWEIVKALKRMSNHKAPGGDLLPVEWYKLILDLEDKKDDESVQPKSVMGQAFLNLVGIVWDSQEIPLAWQEALVVPIPKPGDPSIVDNYRGISLIAVGLKIIMSVVTQRITLALEKKGLLRKEQSGFRTREECLAQVATFVEIVKRQINCGKKAYACFVDLTKAYDTVSHEALLWKMKKIGIWGRCYRLFVDLYKNSTLKVRLPSGLSGSVSVRRGVRQGCVSSPLLFNIFINDMLDETQKWGVKVPGVGERLPGLLFADDSACLTSSTTLLQKSMDAIARWSDLWEMSVGPSKCGVMGFGKGMERVNNKVWTLQGHQIKVVTNYKYLGYMISNDMLDTLHLERNHSMFNGALQAARPFLCNISIPLEIRKLFFRGSLLPLALWGSEIWGMRADKAAKLQKLVNVGMRWLIGSSSKSSIAPTDCLQKELGILPVHAMASARKARLWAKAPSLKTWLSLLVKNPNYGRRLGTWLNICPNWLGKYVPNYLEFFADDGLGSQRMATETKKAVTKVIQDKATAHHSDIYSQNEYIKSNDFHKTALSMHSVSKHLCIISKIRVGGFWTFQRLANIGLISKEYSNMCPCCNEDIAEDVVHLFLGCRAWDEARKEFLQPLIDLIKDSYRVSARDSRQNAKAPVATNVCTILLGGKVSEIGLRHWGRPSQISPDHQAEDVVPHCISVAEYLKLVIVSRSLILNRLTQEQKAIAAPPRTNVLNGIG